MAMRPGDISLSWMTVFGAKQPLIRKRPVVLARRISIGVRRCGCGEETIGARTQLDSTPSAFLDTDEVFLAIGGNVKTGKVVAFRIE
jgi:hypothetical protein